MTPEAILAHPPRVLSQAQRQRYFETGFLAADGVISDFWLNRLRALSAEFIEASKAHTQSNEAYDLGPRHSAATPRCSRPAVVEFHSRSRCTRAAVARQGPSPPSASSKWRAPACTAASIEPKVS